MTTTPPSGSSWRLWRRTRPFWGGLWTAAAAVVLLLVPYGTVHIADVTVTLTTIGGSSSLVIALVLGACTSLMWYRPDLRVVAGVITIVVSVAALAVANLGAFTVGTTWGLLGGSLAVAWRPDASARDRPDDGDGDVPTDPHGTVATDPHDTVDGSAR